MDTLPVDEQVAPVMLPPPEELLELELLELEDELELELELEELDEPLAPYEQ